MPNEPVRLVEILPRLQNFHRINFNGHMMSPQFAREVARQLLAAAESVEQENKVAREVQDVE